ncbi:DUF1573 domain-containing protein [Kiritimatiellota bacterium B12222]|nr:DUF1573 domain-containing protein [Kiritimatiellota bacterium B12222]
MKVIRFVVPVILIFISGVVFGDPELFSAEPQFDFGEEKTGGLVKHEFILENKGDEVLKITNIQTSCGCTTPGVKQLNIDPGEKKSLQVQMDLEGRSGPQTQHVTLSTNDPQNRSYRLKMSGEVIPEIHISPRSLNLEQADMDAPHQGLLTLTSTNGEPFTVKKVKASRGRTQTEVALAEDGMSAEIVVTARPQKGQGHFTDVIVIETSNPTIKEIKVLVMWQVSTGLSISPGQLNLLLSKKPVQVERHLMVRGYPGLTKPLEVTGVEWPGQEVDITFTDTRKFGWRINLKSFTPVKEMEGTEILIHTNAEGFETLKVPVRLIQK